MGISDHYDAIARCNRCGFCQAACPIFRATGHEAGVARGRLALLRSLIEGRVEWSRELEEPLFACLLCGACTANCFPAVQTADLILSARAEYQEKVGRNALHRLLFNHLLPYPRRLRLAARAAALGQRTGLSKVAKALGLLRFLGRDFPRAEEIIAQLPARFLRDRVGRASLHTPPSPAEGGPNLPALGAGAPAPAAQARVGYFVGCGVDIMCPEAGEATLRLLRSLGGHVAVLDNCCCGLPAETYGDSEAAQRLASKNLSLLAGAPFDLIVTDCSSCAAFLKKYPKLFPKEDPRHQAAEAVAARVRDLAQVLGEALPAEGRPPEGGTPVPAEGPAARWRAACASMHTLQQGEAGGAERPIVTYHDPCHASRGQGLVEEPRRLLRSLPGIEYRELPEADWCCGGAGSYALTHYALSRQVLERKMDNLEKTGASVLATSCPACIVHLSYGIRLRGLAVRVCHLSEVVAGRLS